jgi:hypothetical protein
MNIPGFTAEASLYRASAGYLLVSSVDQSGNVIRPQFCDFEPVNQRTGWSPRFHRITSVNIANQEEI